MTGEKKTIIMEDDEEDEKQSTVNVQSDELNSAVLNNSVEYYCVRSDN